MSNPNTENSEDQHVETSPNGRYIRYNAVLGRGSYKTVYKAFDTEEALEVAWNKLHVDRLSKHDLEKVTNEVSLLRQVEHKNIIHFYDTWPSIDSNGNKTLNFITELMMSGTLKAYLKKAKAIKLKVIRRWCSNILEAIAYLHSQDPPIMHRDLKCDNVFINGHVGEVKIGDLGLSGVKEREKADSVIGTPEFMAPELYEESYTEKVDIYAFGMCLLEIVSMEYPYSECNNMAQIFKKVFSGEKPKSFNMLEDGPVKDVIGACLEREENRPSAMELLQHPLFSDWEEDDGHTSNLSLVKGHQADTESQRAEARASSASMPIGTELIDWSDPLQRNVLVSMIDGGEGTRSDENQVSVVASKENGGFYIGLEIPIRDAIKRVEFTFNPFEDNSKHIAEEMVSEFGLGAEQEDVIREEIERQVQIAKSKREAASRNATPQPVHRAPEPDDHLQADNDGVTGAHSLSPPSVSPLPDHNAAVPHHVEHVAEVAATSQPQISTEPPQGEVPNGSNLGASVSAPVLNGVSHPGPTETSSHSLSIPRSHSGIQRSEAEFPDVPVSPVEYPVHQDGLPQNSSFISSQAQSVTSVDTPSGALSPGTVEDTRQVPPILSQAPRLPSVSEPGIGVALHDAQVPQAIELVQSRIPVDSVIQDSRADIISDVEVPTQAQSSPELLVHDHNLRVDRNSLPASTLRTVEQVSHTDINSSPSGLLPEQTETVVPIHEDGSQHSLGTNSASENLQISSQGVPAQPGTGTASSEYHEQSPIQDGDPVMTIPERATEEVVHQAAVAGQSALGSTVFADSRTNTLRREDTGNRHFPQSASDGQLPATSSVTLVNIPPRPPSTPVTPATSGVNLSEEDTALPAMNATSHEQGDVQSIKNTPHTVSAAEEVEFAPRKALHDGISSSEQVSSATIPRSRSGSIPRIVVVGDSSKGAVPEKPRRNFNEIPSHSLPSFASGELPLSSLYFRTQGDNTGIGTKEQVEPVRIRHSQSVPGSESTKKESPLSAQRGSPEKAHRTESWKSALSDDSGNNLVPKVPVGKIIGNEFDQEYYARCLTLMDLCAKGDLEEVLKKLDAGTDPQFSDYDMRTPLHIAAAEGHEHICAVLLERGARVDARDRWAHTPIADAIENGHVQVEHLLKLHGAVFEKSDNEEMLHYELMRGAAAGDLESVRAQIVAGADVTRWDYDRRTPLHLACSEGHTEVAELLLVNGASSEVRDRRGRSPVDDAVNNGHRGILRVLRQYGASIPRHLFEAQPELDNQKGMDLIENTARGRLDAVTQALAEGVDPNFKDYDRRTPLHLACVEGRLDIVRLLLQSGAVVNVADRWGSKPEDEARKAGHSNIIEELMIWESKRKQRQSALKPLESNSTGSNGHSRHSLPPGEERSAHFDQLSHGIKSVSMGAITSINLSADDFAAKYPSPPNLEHGIRNMSTTSLPAVKMDRADVALTSDFDDEQRMLEKEYEEKRLQLEEKRRKALQALNRRKPVDSPRSPCAAIDSVPLAIIRQPRKLPSELSSAVDREPIGDGGSGIVASTSFGSLRNGSEGQMAAPPRRNSVGPVLVSGVTPVQVIGQRSSLRAEDIMARRVNPHIRLLVDNLVEVASRKR
eukprot:GFKZ01003900.1.p1 GENE.GFKZ01003900.1~~GFKZ01003900.1.p1  ORF type:complete len:1603 (-),score=229.65 GFKZ01003900.1:1851-6659(-)